MSAKAYLEITIIVKEENRPAAAKVYSDYRGPFLEQIDGAVSKDLLIRSEDVQILHGFESAEQAEAYLLSKMFNDDVVTSLSPLLNANPETRIYIVA